MKVVDVEKDWVKGRYEVAALVDLSAEEIARAFGAAYDEYDSDGLGRARALFFRMEDGSQFFVEQLLEAPRYHTHVNVYCLHGARAVFEARLIAALKALSAGPEKLTWVQEGLDAARIRAALALGQGGGAKPAPRP